MPEKDPNLNPEKESTGNENQVTLEIDGEKKVFKSEDVQNLIAQQASATQKTQKVAAIAAAAEKYGLDPEEYVERAEGAFGTVVGLIDKEVLDEHGKLIEKKASGDDEPKKIAVDPAKATDTTPADSKELTLISETLEKIEKRTERLESGQLNLMKKNLSSEILEKHPELNNEDVSRLFSIAMADQKKDVWQHAKELVGKKAEGDVVLREKFAKEFKIDLKEWDENKIREQDAEGGGGAAAVLGKKKLSFKAKPGDPNATTPKDAMIEFLAKQEQ